MKRNRKAERLKKQRLSIRQQQEDQRMANLANELGIAGVQVLREHFDFSEEEALKWFDLMLSQAAVNREASLMTVFEDQNA